MAALGTHREKPGGRVRGVAMLGWYPVVSKNWNDPSNRLILIKAPAISKPPALEWRV